uniref:Uncharacterized protein n=1 Tax=Octopus bimaculoides TaxID=37653 RepID=A0A0L8GCX7_OCTBM
MKSENSHQILFLLIGPCINLSYMYIVLFIQHYFEIFFCWLGFFSVYCLKIFKHFFFLFCNQIAVMLAIKAVINIVTKGLAQVALNIHVKRNCCQI